jgi:predicted Zn-dependent protease
VAPAADRVRALVADGLQVRETGGAVGPVSTIADYEIRALAEYRSANLDAALQLLRDAAALDEGHPYEFGPPLPAKPPRELLGELLLREHRPADAKREFELALARTPGRLRSLLGLARASSAVGDSATAERAYGELRRNLANADADFPLLEEIKGSGRGKAR